ncbi:MAG: ABC transporter ATP-binding protein [Clostridia bacterium]|nr:ABC transporter ATP-binding protein [Clostridia bacterium]
MIEVNCLSKTLGEKQVLKDIDLKISKKGIFGLVGENGAGKTSLIKCLTGIYKPEKGSVLFDGKEVFENPLVKQKIGYVADQNQYFTFYKIKDMVSLYKMAYPSFSEERFEQLNKVFTIPKDRRIKQLSKGMKMRLSLMLNLSFCPEYLILDEPTSGLDPLAKREVFRLLLEEVEERSTTVIISSHHLSDLERFCDEIAIIKQGHIQYVNSVDGIKTSMKKLQVVFKSNIPAEISTWDDVMTVESIGRVHYIITKRHSEELVKRLMSKGAMFVEEIDLSLEDMLIYSIKEGNENGRFVSEASAV